MSCHHKKHSGVLRVVRKFFGATGVLLAACAMLLASPAALAVDSGDIVVVSSKGEVHITVNGAARKVRAGGVLELPATLRTGRDGSVELRQGATTVGVGPETLLEFPALERPGAPIDRIVQPRGNAFYNIGKREGRKLRVETPYLVGVIKGTQFNVSAQEGVTTISLFEGLLEVRATDESDVVDLKAGEIASFKRGDKSISILKMDAGKAPTSGARPSSTPSGGSNDGTPNHVPRVTPSNEGGESLLVDRTPISGRVDVDVTADPRAGANVAVQTGIDTGLAAVDVGVDVTKGAADVNTSVDVNTGALTAGLDTVTSVDVAAGTVDAAVGAGVDAGPLTTDVAVAATVDLSQASVDASIDVGVSTPVADVDLGVDVANTIDTVETVTETVTDTLTDTTGGLLDTLTRQPGRK